MAQFFTNFSEYSAGAGAPSGWTARWVTSGATYSVVASGFPSGSNGSQALQCVKTSASNLRSLLSWDDVTPSADVEILLRWARAVDATSSQPLTGGVARASGSAASETGYAGLVYDSTSEVTIVEYNSGTGTNNAQGSTVSNAQPTENLWHWARVRISGSSMQLKFWNDSESEPASYSLSDTDTTLTLAGWIGIYFGAGGTSGANQTYWIDQFSVGTGGDAAPLTEPAAAPEITVAPAASYPGVRTRLGPASGPATVTFTATDINTSDTLTYEIRTATGGGGTLVTSGGLSRGVVVEASIAYDAPGLSGNGSQTLYLTVSDGTLSDEASFTLLQDNVAPVTFTATPDPATVATRSYSLELTAQDATSTATDELTYQVRTAASGDGSLIESGTRTSSGSAFTVASITDNGLENGSNTRYVRVTDGAGNVREVSYVVTGEDLPTRVTTLAVSRARPHPADLITVNIYPPLGRYPRYRLDYDDVNPSTTAISWRSGPGGWTDASVGIAHPLADERYGQPLSYPYLRRAMAQQPFAHVEIRRGPFVVFAGRLGPTQRAGNTSSGFTVNGYGLVGTRDNPYVSADAAVMTSGIVLRSMVSTTAPHLRAANGDDWYDPAVAHAPADFHLMELADALDQVASEGDTVGNQMDWWVYEDQIVVLRARTAPSVPDYHLPNDNNVTWVEDPEWLIGAVTHERTEDGSTVTSSTWDTNPEFVGEHGFQRSQVLQLGEVSADVALALRKTYLRSHSHVFLSGSIELGPDDALTGPGGRVRPKGLARYGQWVQVGREALLMIVSTDYDATAGVLRMEIGEFVPSFETLVANLQRDRLRRQRRLNARAGRTR